MGKKIGKILVLFTCAILIVVVLDRLNISIKYISNGLLALCVAFIINFLVLRKTSQRRVMKKKERLESANYSHSFDNVTVQVVSSFIR